MRPRAITGWRTRSRQKPAAHVVKRVFLKIDGSVESEENTILTFSRTSGNRIYVALAAPWHKWRTHR
jgi:hypothetical protein